ncbi:MAG: glutathione S-transferase family protein [Hyphomicrobiaceae bacterium]
MKLYVTKFSPYARLARVVLREKGLETRINEIVAQTRVVDSPYYEINPSGRVPYLVRADGVGLEGSRLICEFLDSLDGQPVFSCGAGSKYWEFQRLDERARSLMEGLSVWIRELIRPESDRSSAVIEHEIERSKRLVSFWNAEIDHPIMQGTINHAQLALACALLLEQWNPYFEWRQEHSKLERWLDPFANRPSFAATAPPRSLLG